jgi:hypothetical protein
MIKTGYLMTDKSLEKEYRYDKMVDKGKSMIQTKQGSTRQPKG